MIVVSDPFGFAVSIDSCLSCKDRAVDELLINTNVALLARYGFRTSSW